MLKVMTSYLSLADEIIEWGTELLDKDTFPRSNYHELLELTIVYLGGCVYPFVLHSAG